MVNLVQPHQATKWNNNRLACSTNFLAFVFVIIPAIENRVELRAQLGIAEAALLWQYIQAVYASTIHRKETTTATAQICHRIFFGHAKNRLLLLFDWHIFRKHTVFRFHFFLVYNQQQTTTAECSQLNYLYVLQLYLKNDTKWTDDSVRFWYIKQRKKELWNSCATYFYGKIPSSKPFCHTLLLPIFIRSFADTHKKDIDYFAMVVNSRAFDGNTQAYETSTDYIDF